MRQVLLTFILLFCYTSIFSQTDFRKGFIISTSGDTVPGFVNYYDGFKAFRSCAFKKSETDEAVLYEPSAIAGYGFEGDKVFEARTISIDSLPARIVYLEVVVKGLMSLYKFEKTFFIEWEKNGLTQLKNDPKEVLIGKRTLIQYSNQHIAAINMYAYECPELRQRVQRLRLVEREVTKIVEDYNRCKGVSPRSFKAKKPWNRISIGLAGGVNFSNLAFASGDGQEYLAGSWETSPSQIFGATFEVFWPRVSERFSLTTDLLFVNSDYFKFTTSSNDFSSTRNYVSIDVGQLKIPMLIRYTLARHRVTPFIGAGFSMTFNTSLDKKWIREVQINDEVQVFNEPPFLEKGKQLGWVASVGTLQSVHKKLNLTIELRYEQTDGFSRASEGQGLYTDMKLSNFQVMLGLKTK